MMPLLGVPCQRYLTSRFDNQDFEVVTELPKEPVIEDMCLDWENILCVQSAERLWWNRPKDTVPKEWLNIIEFPSNLLLSVPPWPKKQRRTTELIWFDKFLICDTYNQTTCLVPRIVDVGSDWRTPAVAAMVKATFTLRSVCLEGQPGNIAKQCKHMQKEGLYFGAHNNNFAKVHPLLSIQACTLKQVQTWNFTERTSLTCPGHASACLRWPETGVALAPQL